MSIRLFLIYFLIFSPLVTFNVYKFQILKKGQKTFTNLLLLQNQINEVSSTENYFQSMKLKYQKCDLNYLYSQVEKLPLSKNDQKLQLIETPLNANSFYRDKEEALAQTIQVDLKDIVNLLNKIEGDETKKPHLIFTDFILQKKRDPDNIVYDLNFKLTKREYLQ